MEPVGGAAQALVGVVEQTVDGAGPKASEAARRRAEDLGVDLSEIEGTGAGGAITVRDVTRLVESMGDEADDPSGVDVEDAVDMLDDAEKEDGESAEEVGLDVMDSAAPAAASDAGGDDEADGAPKATNAARRRAEELGVDLSRITGSGAGGLITIQDVVKL